MEIAEIRREKLRQYIKQNYKTRAEFADAIGKSPAQVAMWFMKSDGKRDIGEKLAREIETALGRPHGWMDVLHDNEAMRVINGDPMLPSVRLDDKTPEELLKIIVAYEEGSELKQLALQKLSQLPEDKLNAILSLIG